MKNDPELIKSYKKSQITTKKIQTIFRYFSQISLKRDNWRNVRILGFFQRLEILNLDLKRLPDKAEMFFGLLTLLKMHSNKK